MHGVRQVAVNQVSFLGSRPYLFNLFVAGIAIMAILSSQMRKKRELVLGNYLGVIIPYFIFYAVFFIGAVASDAFDDPNFYLLIKRCAPYIGLQLIAVPLLLSLSNSDQINRCFFSTALVCCAILVTVATDSSLRADEVLGQTRLQLVVDNPDIRGANPLALADIGVQLLVIMAFLPLAILKTKNGTLMGSQRIHFFRHSLKVLIMLASLAMTLFISRAEPILGVLAIVLTIAVSTLRVKTSFAFIILLLTTVIFSSIVLPPLFVFLAAYFPRFDAVSEAFNIRIFLWRNSITNYMNSDFLTLLFGLGPGFSFKSVGTYPHNSIVECLTELGLLGLVFWISCLLKPLLRGLTALNTLPRGVFRQNACVLIAMLVYSILVSFKRGSVVNPNTFMWGIVLCAYVDKISQQLIKKTENPQADGAGVIRCFPYSKMKLSRSFMANENIVHAFER